VAPTRNEIRFSIPGKASVVLRTRFAGASSSARIEELEPSPARTSYSIGSSPDHWRPDVANFGKLQVSQTYPGIDLVFHGSGGTLEYGFVIHQRADPARIRFEIDGARSLRVDEDGDLVMATESTEVRWKKPVLYQEVDGERGEIAGGLSTPRPINWIQNRRL
jgi:hypothetical protein